LANFVIDSCSTPNHLGVTLAIRSIVIVWLDGDELNRATKQQGHQGMARFVIGYDL
jgi:hypothetical protein